MMYVNGIAQKNRKRFHFFVVEAHAVSYTDTAAVKNL